MAEDDTVSKEFLQKVLDSIFSNRTEIPNLIDYESKSVVAIGDSYTSNIKRFYLRYTDDTSENEKLLPVIVKIQVRGSIVEDWTIELDFFKTEIIMFSEIFPKFKNQLNISVSSQCYLTTDKPDFALVLEDLQPKGYEMLDRKIGFDMIHTKGILQTLAKLHAGSVVLARQCKEITEFTNGLFSEKKVSTYWMSISWKAFRKTCKSIKECGKIDEKLEALGDEAIKRGVKAAMKSTDGFNVLNHGDMWCNNMLFLHDSSGKLLDTKLIDFQLVKYTSPALDLHYFLATSLSDEIRDKRAELIDFYYSALIHNLVEYGHSLKDIPSRKELQRDFEQRAFYGVISLACVTPLVKAPPHKNANFESLTEITEKPDGFKEFIYSTDTYKQSVKELMLYYDSLGILD